MSGARHDVSVDSLSGSMEWSLSAAPALDDGDVHLWRVSLDVSSEMLSYLHAMLTPDEKVRARRFVFERDRAHFAAARGYLRAILASYAGCNPSEVRFAYGDHGKPYLDDSVCAQDLTFNLSHSRGLALYGVARGRQIGVDVEYIRSEVDILGIARTTFSPDERARLEALPHHRRLRAFYDCWTRKEAYIKARGLGLSYPLDAFDVNIEGNESALLLRSVEGQDEVDRWALHVVDAGAGYSAALAVERPVGGLRLFR